MSYVTSHGYRRIRVGHDHPMADSKGECYEHRIVLANALGRPLDRSEVVHHMDGDKLNNKPENLVLCGSSREHRMAFHRELVTDAELRELILVCGYRFAELAQRGIRNTHRVQQMFHDLRAEGHFVAQVYCPNGHRYKRSERPGKRGGTRCGICRDAAKATKARRPA